MKTAIQAVIDGKLTKEARGAVQLKANEICERIESGTISFDWTLKNLQEIIEGKRGVTRDMVGWMKHLKNYYKDVFGSKITLAENMFPQNPNFLTYMAVHPDLNEDEIMEAIQKFFNKAKDTVNLYKYLDPVAKNINRNKEQKIQKRPSGLYIFAHRGGDEPDTEHRDKSYNDAVAGGLTFANAKEYLLMTGFHKYIKGYFMDKKGWTRTSSLWLDGDLVYGGWSEGGSELELYYGSVDYGGSDSGPRELFLV